MEGDYWQGDIDEVVISFMNRAGVGLVEHKHHKEAAWNERGGFPRALLDTASSRAASLPVLVCVRWPEALRWRFVAANDVALALLSDLPAWAQGRREADERDETLTRSVVVEEAGYWHLQGIMRGIDCATIVADLERLQQLPLLDPPGEDCPRYRIEAFLQRSAFYGDPVEAHERFVAYLNGKSVAPKRTAAAADRAALAALAQIRQDDHLVFGRTTTPNPHALKGAGRRQLDMFGQTQRALAGLAGLNAAHTALFGIVGAQIAESMGLVQQERIAALHGLGAQLEQIARPMLLVEGIEHARETV